MEYIYIYGLCLCVCVRVRAYKDLNTLIIIFNLNNNKKGKLIDGSWAHSQRATRTLICRASAHTLFRTLAHTLKLTHMHACTRHDAQLRIPIRLGI